MNIKSIAKPLANIITHPRVIGPAVFLGIGTAKTLKDYHNSQPNERTKILLKDASILTGSVLAFSAINPITKKFCETAFLKLFIKGLKSAIQVIRKKPITTNNAIKKTGEIIDKTETVIKTAIAGTINTLAGIVGAVLADTFMEKQVFSKYPFKKNNIETQNNNIEPPQLDQTNTKNQKEISTTNKELPQQEKETSQTSEQEGYFGTSNVFNKFYHPSVTIAKQTADRVFSTFSDMPEMKLLSTPMIALTGFSVANTEGYDNKIKKTCYELLANTMIPTVFVTATSMIVENKKALLKYPALLTSLLVGAQAGRKTADYFQEKMNAKIDKMNVNKYFM